MKDTPHRFRALVLLAAIVVAGCGDGGPKLVPAGGTVKYKGKPIAGATVSLLYEDGNMASGVTNEEGKFTLTTGGRPGAPMGKAKVSVAKVQTTDVGGKSPAELTPRDMASMFAKSKEAMKTAAAEKKDELPAKYSNPDTSGLVADVQAKDNDFLFELQD